MSLLPVSETTASQSPSSSCYPSMPADKVLSRPWPRAGSALFVSKATRATNPVCPIYTQSQKLPRIHGVKFGSRFFGSSEAFSWVTVGHGKLRAATNGHMDIVFQGGRGRGNSAKLSPSKPELRFGNPLRSFSKTLMLFGLVVTVAKAAIATRVLIARAGRNDSAFGKHLGYREYEHLDIVEQGSHHRRPRSYKAWTSAVLAFPVLPRAAAL